MTNPADIARALSEYWMPIETAPKDGSAILIRQEQELPWIRKSYMPPGALRDGEFSYNNDDPRLLFYDDQRYAIGYWRPWGGWGNRNSSRVIPSLWMPLPEFHRPTIDASTDRNQAKVVRCGKEIE